MYNLYSYVFHYNPSDEVWSAIPRDEYHKYWNGEVSKNILRSKDIKVLVELISKGEEFIRSVK